MCSPVSSARMKMPLLPTSEIFQSSLRSKSWYLALVRMSPPPAAVSLIAPSSITHCSLSPSCLKVRHCDRSLPSNSNCQPSACSPALSWLSAARCSRRKAAPVSTTAAARSEEHTSELQSRENLVCRLLLEKKNEDHRQARRGDEGVDRGGKFLS